MLQDFPSPSRVARATLAGYAVTSVDRSDDHFGRTNTEAVGDAAHGADPIDLVRIRRPPCIRRRRSMALSVGGVSSVLGTPSSDLRFRINGVTDTQLVVPEGVVRSVLVLPAIGWIPGITRARPATDQATAYQGRDVVA